MHFLARTCPPVMLLIATLPAQAATWYPLEAGTRWVYSSPYDAVISGIIQDEDPFAGSPTRALRWSNGSDSHYSEDASGRVLFHGVTYPDGRYVVFSPPLVSMESGLAVGMEWESVATVIHYSADHEILDIEEAVSTYRVVETAEVAVPAGNFSTFEIERVEETGPVGASALFASAPDGALPARRHAAGRRFRFAFRESYAAGIGWVRRTGEGGVGIQFRLEAFGVNGVRATTSTFSALKSTFRD